MVDKEPNLFFPDFPGVLPRINGHWSECAKERIATLERDLAAVIQLGRDFGFPTEPFGIGQVITHVKYLQQERARLLFDTIEFQTDFAAAKARIATLEEESRVWEKTSLVQMVEERRELRERVAMLTEAIKRTVNWFEEMANAGTLTATLDLRGRLHSALDAAREKR